jgi:hypothetical protein
MDNQCCVHVETNVIRTANDFDTAEVYCRLAFSPGDGKVLAVPATDGVRIYSRDTWKSHRTLSQPDVSLVRIKEALQSR